jgi:hypothetical protein
MTNVVKFPHSASRPGHSRKPRISNGAPVEWEPPLVELIQKLRTYVVQEFARGQDI